MPKIFDRVKIDTPTTGTGDVTFGSATTNAFRTPTEAGCIDGDTIRYCIVDGTDFELGIGTIGGSVTTMARTTVTESKIGGTVGTDKIGLSGVAIVAFTNAADDMMNPANNLSDLISAPTALTNLGATTVGKALFTATDAAAASKLLPIRSYLAGLTLSTAGGSGSFGIAAGVAADSTNTDMISLATAMTKSGGSWAVGSGNGALDAGTGSINTWYHVFLIKRPDTGVVDVLLSLSATAPTLPTNYTLFRRIGSVFMDAVGSGWLKFSQFGDEFLWDVSSLITDANNLVVNATSTLVTLRTPPGVKTFARIKGLTTNHNILISEPDAGVQVHNTPTANQTTNSATGVSNFIFNVRTNTSSQISVVGNTTGDAVFAIAYGWIDRRGRDD